MMKKTALNKFVALTAALTMAGAMMAGCGMTSTVP